jgi:hypothetical protein
VFDLTVARTIAQERPNLATNEQLRV